MELELREVSRAHELLTEPALKHRYPLICYQTASCAKRIKRS